MEGPKKQNQPWNDSGVNPLLHTLLCNKSPSNGGNDCYVAIKVEPSSHTKQKVPNMEGARPEPKPRPIKLESHILAYLGDFMSVFEESIKRIAKEEVSKIQSPAAPSPAGR